MVYDRYAGIKSLPGPDGKMPRPFRVDENWNVIYLDEEQGAEQPEGKRNAGEQSRAGIMSWEELDRRRDEELDAIRSLGEDKSIKLAEAPNANWNGYDVLHAQGQRDGQILRDIYDRHFPDKDSPVPPASQTYGLPPATKAWPGDPQHRFVLDRNGKLVQNPEYQRAYGATETDKWGVAKDLGKIALGVAIPLRAGAMAATGAAMMVGSSAAKAAYEQANERRSKTRKP
jgi:hypothetical protein